MFGLVVFLAVPPHMVVQSFRGLFCQVPLKHYPL